ncbi:MAG: hypothetical protein JWO05_1150 [Gemmatimonadetes bacterium]|nr:hypothetical protein [Gemmatimonadota bacterium]
MIVDPLRLLVEWLSDPATGINAQLAAVPRDGGEPAPAAVQFFHELAQPWVARGAIHRDALVSGPALILRHTQTEHGFTAAVFGERLNADPTLVPFSLLYASLRVQDPDAPADSAVQVRDARQVMRAAFRIIALRFPSPQTAYVRNSCVVTLSDNAPVFDAKYIDAGDSQVLDSLHVELKVLDRWALAIT